MCESQWLIFGFTLGGDAGWTDGVDVEAVCESGGDEQMQGCEEEDECLHDDGWKLMCGEVFCGKE